MELDPEIIIAAPSISRELKETVASMNMKFRLVEISKFRKEDSMMIVSHEIEQPEMERKGPREGYKKGWSAFKKRKNASEEEIELMKTIADKLTDLFEEKGWNIEMDFKRNYIAFQYGNRNIVTMKRRKNRARLKIKTGVSPPELEFEIPDDLETGWDEKHEEVIFYIKSKSFDISRIEKLFEKAYSYVK